MTKTELINQLNHAMADRNMSKTVVNGICDQLFDLLSQGAPSYIRTDVRDEDEDGGYEGLVTRYWRDRSVMRTDATPGTLFSGASTARRVSRGALAKYWLCVFEHTAWRWENRPDWQVI